MKYLILAVCLCSYAFADIRELKALQDIPEAKPSETLFIFDIDNTLLAPVQTLGTDQWFEARVHALRTQFEKDGLEAKQAQSKALTEALILWREIQKKTDVRPIEKGTAAFIAEKQKAGFYVIGLTARPLDLKQTTLRQLKSIEIDLEPSSLSKKRVVINASANPDYQSELTQGVVFSGLHPKGPTLLKLLKTKGVKFQPKQIYFIDDKHKNVESVETTLNEAKLPHTCFRYSVEDATVAKYNENIAKTQLDYFQKILSDAAAEAINRTQAN